MNVLVQLSHKRYDVLTVPIFRILYKVLPYVTDIKYIFMYYTLYSTLLLYYEFIH